MHVYLITDLLHGKQYVGAEKGNNSEYFGSGSLIREAIEKFGKWNFKKEILIDDIGDWEDCLELESYCILSLDTLEPDGYNQKAYQWPPPAEASRISGPRNLKKWKRERPEEFLRHQSKAGKIGGKIGGKIAGRMVGKALGKRTGKKNLGKWKKEHREEFLEVCRRSGKTAKELKIGIHALKMRGIGGKMRACVLFEIDGLIQQTTLSEMSRT